MNRHKTRKTYKEYEPKTKMKKAALGENILFPPKNEGEAKTPHFSSISSISSIYLNFSKRGKRTIYANIVENNFHGKII